MAQFNNSWLNNLQKQLNSKATFTDNQIAKILKQKAKELQSLLWKEISYYKTVIYPNPVQYRPRTEAWERSIQIKEPYKDADGFWVIAIVFDKDLALHPSVVHAGDPSQAGFVPWLMEVGWHWSEDKQPRIDMFTDYNNISGKNGTKYIQKAVAKFNESNADLFKVSVFFDDKQYI